MATTQHSSTLTQVTRLFFFNTYLVREDDGLTLIDTGMPGSAPGIMAAAQALDAPVRRIVLTHAHADHVGSLDALAALLPDVEVLVSARDARIMAGDKSLDAEEAQMPLKGSYPTVQTKPTRLLTDGDTVGSLVALATPGHTPGHLAFFDPRDGSLIAGDAYTTQAGLSTAGTLRILFPFPAMATWHKARGIESAEKLAALKPARLVTGHGSVLNTPDAAMRGAIQEAQQKVHHAR
jgi:glyoxylase-like metal-dependent hydrolase (beta-lactamase superfamily II)